VVYYHFYRKKYFKNDGGFYNTWQMLRSYLFGGRQGFKLSALCAGIAGFLSFYLPVYYCASKILVTISNFLMGAFVNHAKFVSRANGWSNYYVDLKSEFWSSWQGKFLLFTDSIIKSKHYYLIENGVLFVVLVACIAWYIKYELKKQFKETKHEQTKIKNIF
jgi:hypothetical protein